MIIQEEYLPYAVGGLLYTPATNENVAANIVSGVWPCLTSVALCLEDSIQDSALEYAEKQLGNTLDRLVNCPNLPLLFVRVRNPEHFEHVSTALGERNRLLAGYIFPKFDLSNADRFLSVLDRVRSVYGGMYAMPILESPAIAGIASRRESLTGLNEKLLQVKDRILNIRVGGNDFSNIYGIRRSVCRMIYDAGVIRDILADISNVFSPNFVVSGPVWEYYGDDINAPWAAGLRRELELDLMNGFTGKTAIHPSQLPLIYDSLKVSEEDYADACRILNWSESLAGVSGGCGKRMNEVKTHSNWAGKILIRKQIYGLRAPDEGCVDE